MNLLKYGPILIPSALLLGAVTGCAVATPTMPPGDILLLSCFVVLGGGVVMAPVGFLIWAMQSQEQPILFLGYTLLFGFGIGCFLAAASVFIAFGSL